MPFLTTVLRTKKKLPLRRKSTGFTARKFPIYTNPLIPQVSKSVTERAEIQKRDSEFDEKRRSSPVMIELSHIHNESEVQELECEEDLKKLLDCMKNNAFKDKDCANEKTSFERCMKAVVKRVELQKEEGYVVGETGGRPPTKVVNTILRRFKPPDMSKLPE